MYSVQEVERKGKKIVVMDISECTEEEYLKAVEESAAIIRSCPPSSAFVMVKTGEKTPIFTDKADFLEYLRKNAPHVKASAVSLPDRLRRGLIEAVISSSGRKNVRLFDTHEDAEDWLLKQ